MSHQTLMDAIVQQQNELDACRHSIESSSAVVSRAVEGKHDVLSHMRACFTDLEALARYLDGDYDARVKAKQLSPASSESPLIASLVQNVEAALGRSDALAEQVKSELIKGLMTSRTKLGAIRDAIDATKAGADVEVATLQREIVIQQHMVTQAEKDEQTAYVAYTAAKERSEKAEADAKWWKEYAEYKPPWYLAFLGGFKDQGHGMNSEAVQKLLEALKHKEAAAIDLNALESRRKELNDFRTTLHLKEAEKANLDAALSQLQHVQTTASSALHDCEVVIERCRNVEYGMTSCKTTLNSILFNCQHIQELVTRGDYVQTKSDYLDVILECLAKGTFDIALVEQAKDVLQILETGDSTNLLKQAQFAEIQTGVKRLFEGVAQIGPLNSL